MKRSILFLVVIVCFLLTSNVFSQEKVNLKIGASYPELLHVGASYQLKQFQFGAYVGGGIPLSSNPITLSGDISFHFGGHSKYSERKPWYLRSGYTYSQSESETKTWEDRFLNLRIGRDLNISSKFGFEIDLGLFFHLNHKESYKDPTLDSQASSETSSGYFFGVGMFYRL